MDNDDQISIYTNYTNYNDAFVVVFSPNIFDSENIVLLIVDSLWHGQATSTKPWRSWSRYSALANCRRRCGRRTCCILFSPRHSVQRLCRTRRRCMSSEWKRRRCRSSRSWEPRSSVFEHSRPCWTTKERCSSVSRRERERGTSQSTPKQSGLVDVWVRRWVCTNASARFLLLAERALRLIDSWRRKRKRRRCSKCNRSTVTSVNLSISNENCFFVLTNILIVKIY